MLCRQQQRGERANQSGRVRILSTVSAAEPLVEMAVESDCEGCAVQCGEGLRVCSVEKGCARAVWRRAARVQGGERLLAISGLRSI